MSSCPALCSVEALTRKPAHFTVSHSCPYLHSSGLRRLLVVAGQMDGRRHHCCNPPQFASPLHHNYGPLWFLWRISPLDPCLGAFSSSHLCPDFCLYAFPFWI